ncbi:hypothetical protein ROM10_18385 [Cronobacter sakazakii]|uniref:hypothetical protein n=1 Tax=Cronobacter sakazakii TaxID=28141 RepID=UPI00289581D1|nr:hypothetical protein [Cronobacter sakazakii]MDT3612013.1 hypothetical protein [Cronobacter sakazakii]
MNTAKLKAAAERQKSILACIASFEPADIDSDTVDLRFEDDNGCDSGCDVSVVEECQRSADLIGELIAALEAAEKRIGELEARTVTLPRPACTYADHSYPAYSEKQVVDLLESLGINFETGGE